MAVTLRRTLRLAKALPVTAGEAPSPDTALGDWYVNRLVVDRRPLLLLISSQTLFPILLPAQDVSTLPQRLPEVVAQRLRRAGIAQSLIAAEIAAMSPVHVAKTGNRAVVGILVDFAFAVPLHLPVRAWDATTLPFIEAALAETPCFSSRPMTETVFPDRDTTRALIARWGAV